MSGIWYDNKLFGVQEFINYFNWDIAVPTLRKKIVLHNVNETHTNMDDPDELRKYNKRVLVFIWEIHKYLLEKEKLSDAKVEFTKSKMIVDGNESVTYNRILKGIIVSNYSVEQGRFIINELSPLIQVIKSYEKIYPVECALLRTIFNTIIHTLHRKKMYYNNSPVLNRLLFINKHFDKHDNIQLIVNNTSVFKLLESNNNEDSDGNTLDYKFCDGSVEILTNILKGISYED